MLDLESMAVAANLLAESAHHQDIRWKFTIQGDQNFVFGTFLWDTT